jgi:quercetin dioxygenase-like cupin family protein
MSSFECKPEDAAQAALHALRALDAEAARKFETRVDDDKALEAELLAMRKVADELAPLAPAVAPEPALLGRVLDAVRAAPASRTPAVTPFTEVVNEVTQNGPRRAGHLGFVFGDEAEFKPLKLPGISARTLHRDEAAGFATVMVRMQPGTSYPAHRHGDDEECYVLEGDLEVGEQVMHAGDYQVARRGSVHPVQRTRGGCLLLLRSSLHDELLEAS